MILTAPFVVLALRWLPPALVIFGSVVTHSTVLAAVRILTWPFPERVFRRVDEKMYGSYQAMVGFFYETWSGVEFCFYGDKLPDTPENALYLSNHQCSVDWVVTEVLCVKQGGHGGRARYILKDALKYVPIYGWLLGDHGGIYIKRQKSKDQEKLIRWMKMLAENDYSVWLVVFPEGTRFNPSKPKMLERSHAFARNLGLPELNQVLTPKTAGFELALLQIRDHFKAVYDITILYEGFPPGQPTRAPPPNLFGFFSGQCSRVHVHIRRTPIEDIPLNPEQQRAWLYEAYNQKERLIEGFLTTGSFDAPTYPHPLTLGLSAFPVVLYTTTLIGVLSFRYGCLWWCAAFGVFGAFGIIRMALKS